MFMTSELTAWLSGSGGAGKTPMIVARLFWRSVRTRSGTAAVRLQAVVGRAVSTWFSAMFSAIKES
jgi:hypothetical protein